MNIQAGVTRICLFDLHFAATPLRTPALLQPGVSFLGVPGDYEKRHDVASPTDTARFALRPFGARQHWSHFWKGFRAISSAEGTGEAFPRFHLPIDGGMRDASFSANLPVPFGRVPVHARLLLWPYGWSTRFELSLTALAGLQALADVSRWLRNDPVFDVQSSTGTALLTHVSLSSLFRQVTSWLQEDLFTGKVAEQRPVSRHAVIALSGFTAPADPFTYNTEVDPEHPTLPTADRARLHSLLLGRVVPLPELIERERTGAFAVTGLTATGFALTDFNAGSLLVLHDSSPRTGNGKTAARCLWRNTTAMLTTTSALLAVDRGLRTKPANWMDRSADWGVRMLRAIPTYYDSPVCRQVFGKHRDVRRVTGS